MTAVADSEKSSEQEGTLIAIVGYNNGGDIRACLIALAASTDENFEISICENGGPAAYQNLIEELSDVVDFCDIKPKAADVRVDASCGGRLRPNGQTVKIYKANANLGYAGGVNVTLRQILAGEPSSAVWILNPDTEPVPAALSALVMRARLGGCSLVSSRLVIKSTKRVQSYGGRWRRLLARGYNIGWNASQDHVPDFVEIEKAMTYVSGASLFATRGYVERVGLMDERYFLYCEEVDWCFRRGGERIGYAHDALVYHSYGTAMGSSSNLNRRSSLSVYLDERNKILLTREFFPRQYPFTLAITLLLTLQYLKAGSFANFYTALSGWFAGLRGQVGLPKRFYELAR